jgi:hypothetical protein
MTPPIPIQPSTLISPYRDESVNLAVPPEAQVDQVGNPDEVYEHPAMP